MYERLVDELVQELRALLRDLGKDGGLISPSIYDTSRVLCLYPPNDVNPALDWLASQQQADGGWGDAAVPTARDVPTLAAVLALHKYRKDKQTRAAIDAGLRFLERQAYQWEDIDIDLVPIAAEMILPQLIEEAHLAGIEISSKPYGILFGMRERKLKYLAKAGPIRAGSSQTYSWEALGHQLADPDLVDNSGGVGHSPAATAAWLQLADRDTRSDSRIRHKALRYLADAAKATPLAIPGIVPVVWPISCFEVLYSCYAAVIAGLHFCLPMIEETITPHAHTFSNILIRHGGLGFSIDFMPDVDDTAVGLVLAHVGGVPVEMDQLEQFRNGEHFYTYRGELNPSVLCNAHACYAFAVNGKRDHSLEDFLVERQLSDGRWLPDKFHSSWHYLMLEVILALNPVRHSDEIIRAREGIVRNQYQDGGWGESGESTSLVTAYSMLALSKIHDYSLADLESIKALQRGRDWLLKKAQQKAMGNEKHWLGKELYSPIKVDRSYILSAMLAAIIEPVYV